MSYRLVINKLKQNNNQVWYVLDAYDYKDYLIDPIVLIKQSHYNRENYVGWANYSFPNIWKCLGIAPNADFVGSAALEDLPKPVFSNAVLSLNELILMPNPDGFVISLSVPIFKKDENEYVLLKVEKTSGHLSTKAVKLNNGDELVSVRHECVIEINVGGKKGKKGGGIVQQPVHLYALRVKSGEDMIDLVDRDEFEMYASEYNAQCPNLTFPTYSPAYRMGSVFYGWEDFWTVPPFDVVDRLKQYLESRFSRPVRLLLYVVDVDLRALLKNLLGDNPANTTDEMIELYFRRHLGYIPLNDFVSMLNSFVVHFDGLLFQDYASTGNFIGLATPHSNYTQRLYENITHPNKIYLASYSGTFRADTLLQPPVKDYFSLGVAFTPPYVMCEECANDVKYYSPLLCDHGELYYNLDNRKAGKCKEVYRDLLNNLYEDRSYNYKAEIVRQRPQLLLTQHFYKDAIGIFEFPNKSIRRGFDVPECKGPVIFTDFKFGMIVFKNTPTEYNVIQDHLIAYEYREDCVRIRNIVMRRTMVNGAFHDLYIFREQNGRNIVITLRMENASSTPSEKQLYVDYVLGDLVVDEVVKISAESYAVWEIRTNKGVLTYSSYYNNYWGDLSIPFSTQYLSIGFKAGVNTDTQTSSVSGWFYRFNIDGQTHGSSVYPTFYFSFEPTGDYRLALALFLFWKIYDSNNRPYFMFNSLRFPYNFLSGSVAQSQWEACPWIDAHNVLLSTFVENLDGIAKFNISDIALRYYFEVVYREFSNNIINIPSSLYCKGGGTTFYPSSRPYELLTSLDISIKLPEGSFSRSNVDISEQLAPYYQLFSLYSASKVLRNKTVYLSSLYLSPIEYFLAQNIVKVWFPFNWLYHQATYPLTDEEDRCCLALRRSGGDFPEPPEGSIVHLPQPNTVNTPVYSEELQAQLSSSLIQPFTHSSGKFFERIPDAKTDLSLLHKKVPFLSYLQASPFAIITDEVGQWLGEIVKTEQGKYYIVLPTDYTDIVSQFIELGFAEYVEKEEGSTVLVIRNPLVLTTILKQSDGKFREVPNVRIRLVDIS